MLRSEHELPDEFSPVAEMLDGGEAFHAAAASSIGHPDTLPGLTFAEPRRLSSRSRWRWGEENEHCQSENGRGRLNYLAFFLAAFFLAAVFLGAAVLVAATFFLAAFFLVAFFLAVGFGLRAAM
jgi:hypothetical protein